MAGLHSWQIPCKSNTKLPFKTVLPEGYSNENLILYSVWLCHWRIYRPVQYTCTVYTVYIHFCAIYVLIPNAVKMYEMHIHSFWYSSLHLDWDDLATHTHFSSWLNTFCNSMSIIMNCKYAATGESNITAYINNLFTFFKSAYYA